MVFSEMTFEVGKRPLAACDFLCHAVPVSGVR